VSGKEVLIELVIEKDENAKTAIRAKKMAKLGKLRYEKGAIDQGRDERGHKSCATAFSRENLTQNACASRIQTVPENRVYVSPDRADGFVRSFVRFSRGKIVSDNGRAPGVEIGRAGDTYRRIRIESVFGKMTVLVTDGQLPYPYGREMTGYEVTNLAETLGKAKAAGVTVLVDAFNSNHRDIALVQFPGGYVAELHAASK